MESLNTLRQEWNWVLQRNTRMVWSKIRKRIRDEMYQRSMGQMMALRTKVKSFSFIIG